MKYYSMKPTLDKYKPQYMIPYGKRSKGKSWSAKDIALGEFMNTEKKFVYIRRWSEDLKGGLALDYWAKYIAEGGLKKATKGKYNDIEAKAHKYYLIKRDASGNVQERAHCGYYLDLNSAERWKSTEYVNVKYLIFEEVFTKGLYIRNEPEALQQLVSTICRNSTDAVVFLIGNTVSRICPYLQFFGIQSIKDQPVNTVKIYNKKNELGQVCRVVVERTPDDDPAESKNTLYIGKSAKNILLGEWDVDDMPIRPEGEYETHYELAFEAMGESFILQLQSDADDNLFLYISPNEYGLNLERTINRDKFSADRNKLAYFRSEIKAECMIVDLYNAGQFCFSDVLTGNDFTQVLQNYGTLFTLR